MHRRYSYSLAIFFFCILSMPLMSLFTDYSTAQEDALVIAIWDYDNEAYTSEYILLEGKDYGIEVWYQESNTLAYGVTVTVLGNTYLTSENELDEIQIETPSYEEYPNGFDITATKSGYTGDQISVTISRGPLRVNTTVTSITEKQDVTVTVHDHQGDPISGATITMDTTPVAETDAYGEAVITTPDVPETQNIQIQAYKDGYQHGSVTIEIRHVAAPFFPFDYIDPLYLAILLVILAIVFVTLRNRKLRRTYMKPTHSSPSKNTPEQEENTDPSLTPEVTIQNKHVYSTNEKVVPLSVNNKQSKVEEIRIKRPGKQKDTQYIKEEPEKKKKKPLRHHRKHEYDWFEGTENMRYKIDKITGEIDEDTIDKWFEGVEDIRSKIDEAITKKNKKHKK